MKTVILSLAALPCLAASGCVAGPGGVNNAANRTVAGAALGAVLGGVAGKAGGAVIGAIAGGALGAAVNPGVFGAKDTRGDCYTTDAQGNPIILIADEMECKVANGQMLPPGHTAGR